MRNMVMHGRLSGESRERVLRRIRAVHIDPGKGVHEDNDSGT